MSDAVAAYLDKLYRKDLRAIPVEVVSQEHSLEEYRGLGFFRPAAITLAEIPKRTIADSVPPLMRRAVFVACLYLDMLLDQSLHAHFREHHVGFAQSHPLPKLGAMGMGPHVEHPNALLRAAIPGFVSQPAHLELAYPLVHEQFFRRADSEKVGVPVGEAFDVLRTREGTDVRPAAVIELVRGFAREQSTTRSSAPKADTEG